MQKLLEEINRIDAAIAGAERDHSGKPEDYKEVISRLKDRKARILEEIAHKRKMLTLLLCEVIGEVDNCVRLNRPTAAHQLLAHSILLASQIYEERSSRWEEIREGLKAFRETEGLDFATEFVNIVFLPI
jgi:hypothetical protein